MCTSTFKPYYRALAFHNTPTRREREKLKSLLNSWLASKPNRSQVEIIRGEFHQTFSPSKKTPVYGDRRKICHSISPRKFKAKIIGQNLLHLCPPFAKCCSPKNFGRKKFSAKMLMKSTPGGE
jgi:hypothetical protein